MLVHDYFGATSATKKAAVTNDPMSKGFYIRAFRIKQATIRQREAAKASTNLKPGSKGFGTYAQDDDFGVKMETMNFTKEDLVIEADEVIKNFNNEALIR